MMQRSRELLATKVPSKNAFYYAGAWLSIRGTTVTGTVLVATEFSDFYVIVKMLTPLISKTSGTVACRPL